MRWWWCLAAVLVVVGCDDGSGDDGSGERDAPLDSEAPEAGEPPADASPPDATAPDAAPPLPDAAFVDPPDRAPLFAQGCPRPGRARVDLIEDEAPAPLDRTRSRDPATFCS
jgi:hypothetical protein